MTQPAPLGFQLAAAPGISEPSATDHGKTKSSGRAVKRAPHFSNLLGDLVEKEETPGATAAAGPLAFGQPTPPAPPKREPTRFLWGGADREPLAAANELRPQDAVPQQGSRTPGLGGLTTSSGALVPESENEVEDEAGRIAKPDTPDAPSETGASGPADVRVLHSNNVQGGEQQFLFPLDMAALLRVATSQIQPEQLSRAGSDPRPATSQMEMAASSPAPPGESLPPGVPAFFAPLPSQTSEEVHKTPAASGPRVNPDDSPRPASLAFAARLVPMPARPVAPPEPTPANNPLPSGPHDRSAADTAPSSTGQAAHARKEPSKNGQPEAQSTDLTSTLSQPEVTASVMQTASSQGQDAGVGESPSDSAGPLALRAETPLDPALGIVDGSAATPARDIHLQLNRGEQRVDVRLSERSGEVRVAVRTPDPQLAGVLRDDLPRLSDQLEQTGFRTETWHPPVSGTPAGFERRLPVTDPSFSNPPGGGQSQPRQDGQQQQQPRQPKPNGAPASTNPQRKEFRWLMSQLP